MRSKGESADQGGGVVGHRAERVQVEAVLDAFEHVLQEEVLEFRKDWRFIVKIINYSYKYRGSKWNYMKLALFQFSSGSCSWV